jgi:hypothetical protein
MVKDAADAPDGAVIESHELQANAEAHTSRKKVCVAFGEVPLVALIVIG